MQAIGMGSAELTLLLMFLGGFGLPLGVPPAPENPSMQYVAPAECMLYASWAGMATPDAGSANHTEQLLAEPEVQAFAQSLEKSLGTALAQLAEQNGDPKGALAAKFAPLWAKTVITHSAAVFVSRAAVVEGKLDFEGGILVDAGEQAKELVAGFEELLQSPTNKPEDVTIGKVTFRRFAVQAEGPLSAEVTIGTAGPYVLLGIGKQAVEGMIERLRAKQIAPWLTELQERLPVKRRGSMSYINVKGIVDAFLPLAGPEGERIAESLGVRQLGEMTTVTGLDDEGMVSRGFMKVTGEPKGLLLLLQGSSIKPEQLDFVPKDAVFAGAFSLNAQQLYHVVGQLVSENVPGGEEVFGMIGGQFEGMFGMKLREDVLASLGDVWTVSMSPADGWLGMTMTVEVTDRAKLVPLLDKVQAMLSDAPPGESPAAIESIDFAGHKIQMLALPEVPIRLSWCVTDSRLVFSLSPQTIKAHLTARKEEIGLFNQPLFAAAFKGEGELTAIGYQDSAKLFETTYSYVTLLVPMMMEGMNAYNREQGMPAAPAFDFSTLPSARSIHRHLRPAVSFTRRTKDGLVSESRQTLPTPNVATSAPIVAAFALPAFARAREAARRAQSLNNLRQIMLALHNHHDAFKGLPPAYSLSAEGKPLLSWRVHILPFIEENALYEEFHLDEPWDSEHNKKLIPRMPTVYRSQQSAAPPGMTVYLGVAGKSGLFPAPTKETEGHRGGVGFAQITDGTSNTIAVVEASDELAVEWTKPADFTPDEKEPLKGLIGLNLGGFNAAICDGSVRFISGAIDPKMLMNAFQRDDGNVVDLGN